MADYVYWFLLALGLLALEMLSGTFYMLVLALALAVGGVVALLGAGLTWQLALSGVVGVVGTVLLRRSKATRPGTAASDDLDIGQAVQVLDWRGDGSLRVHYRGADWDAETESAETPRDVPLYIKSRRGSTLILSHLKPQ